MPTQRSHILISVFCLVCTIAACATNNSVHGITQEQCQQVREHMADLRLASFAPMGLTEAEIATERAKHRHTLSELGGLQALEICMQSKTPAWVSCALSVEDLSQLRSCS